MSNKIALLMAVSEDQRDLNWLKSSLQAALELELSTIPPYLCGLWSVKDDTDPVGNLIRSVVLEEMLHLGLACNLLTAVGGTPRIHDGFKEIVYPGPLPGGVRPNLTVYLAGLSKLYIQQVYLQIEYPEDGPVHLGLAATETFPTIGNFYDTILERFKLLNPKPTTDKQLSNGDVGLVVIKTLGDVEQAITLIKHQGEGTRQSPQVPGSMNNELAHYYKFAEILFERTLQQTDGKWDFTGAAIPFPATYPVVQVPAGGFQNAPDGVRKDLDKFNQAFAELLGKLDGAWSKGAQSVLDTSVGMMGALSAAVVPLMQVKLPDNSGVYGPEFRLPG